MYWVETYNNIFRYRKMEEHANWYAKVSQYTMVYVLNKNRMILAYHFKFQTTSERWCEIRLSKLRNAFFSGLLASNTGGGQEWWEMVYTDRPFTAKLWIKHFHARSYIYHKSVFSNLPLECVQHVFPCCPYELLSEHKQNQRAGGCALWTFI